MKIIYITGSNGFIGQRLMDYFHKVPKYKIYGIQQGKNKVKNNIIYSDYQDFKFLKDQIKTGCFVIHTAAFIPEKNKDNETVRVINNGITNFVIKAFKAKKIENLFYTSGINVYGINKKNTVNINEDAEIILDSYYARSKYDSEVLLSNNFERNYNLRISSPFGKGKKTKNLLEELVTKVLKNEKITIYGKGERRQDFVWVEDVARAIEQLIEKNAPPGDYNLCSGNSPSVQELIFIMEEIMNKKINFASIKKPESFSITLSNDKFLKAIEADKSFFTPLKDAIKEIL